MVKSESMTVTLQILNSRIFCIFFVETFRFAISIHACRTKYFTIDTGKQINMRLQLESHLKNHLNRTLNMASDCNVNISISAW